MRFSERINSVKESGTLKFTPLIAKLRKEGKKIVDLSVGEPSSETPDSIIEATKKALDGRKTRYDNVLGSRDLRLKIAGMLDPELGYDDRNIMITNGSKQALYNIFQALCNPGDEVIIPRPYWTSFSEQVKLAGAKPVFTDTISNQLDIGQIKAAVNSRTRAILVNSPNNPTGAVYKKPDMRAVVDLADEKDLFIVSDNAYEMLVYDGLEPYDLASSHCSLKERIITVKSFSKTYSMTGFRVGYMVAEEEIIKAMNKLQGHSTGNVCTFAQYGAIAALDIGKDAIKKSVADMERKRDLAYKLAKRLFECIKPQGAFYLFPDIKNALGKGIKNSEELSAYFLEKANVAVVPGTEFGAENHIRISYATDEDEIKRGFENISKVL